MVVIKRGQVIDSHLPPVQDSGMHMLTRRAGLIAAVAAGSVALAPGTMSTASTAHTKAAAALSWTKISTATGIGSDEAGLFRTSDGRLHALWTRHDASSYSLHYSTISTSGALLASGTVLSGWASLALDPRLVPAASGGIRLVFPGANGMSGSPFNLDAMYTATASAAGTSWTLVHGSMSQSTLVPLTGDAAVTESGGTPVAAWEGGSGIAYHVGVDTNIPSTTPDQTVAVAPGGAVSGTALARAKDGSIWTAWFTAFESDQGYWVDHILPSKTAKAKAPGSGGPTLAINQPLQQVALTETGSGGYLAYCVATSSVPCDHIALWKVGASTAKTVPGSTTKAAKLVTIAAAPGGHLWILWADTGLNKIRVIRTNAAVTKFGPVKSLALPPNTFQANSLQAEGRSRVPLDVIALAPSNTSGFPVAFWDTQVHPALGLKGSPATVTNTQATTVTFTVTDVGDPVPGATVKFLGKTVTTNSSGVAQVTVPKGTPTGSYVATASKTGYTSATFTIKVTT